MAVVINEVEVSAQAPPPPSPNGAQAGAGGGSASSPESVREIAKTLHKEAERQHRLWAH